MPTQSLRGCFAIAVDMETYVEEQSQALANRKA